MYSYIISIRYFIIGWKRELVYRTSSDSTAINRNNRNGDVYYYSPNNRKLRSLREIQEQLDIYLTDTSLTIDSFTFLKQPIGMDDRSKEIIRDANTKLSKVINKIKYIIFVMYFEVFNNHNIIKYLYNTCNNYVQFYFFFFLIYMILKFYIDFFQNNP